MGTLRRWRRRSKAPKWVSARTDFSVLFDPAPAPSSHHGAGHDSGFLQLGEWATHEGLSHMSTTRTPEWHREMMMDMYKKYMLTPQIPQVPPGDYVVHQAEGGATASVAMKGSSVEEMRWAARPNARTHLDEMGAGGSATDWGRNLSPLEMLDRDVEEVCRVGRGEFAGDFARGGVIEHALINAGNRRRRGTATVDMFDEGLKDSIVQALRGR